ncbi:hypothetical protein LTR10_021336 [Elasticomyces elasticus]|uniref:Tim44-like domain-containing protein n=1 Tax=Exophiala sideris TaxID=1016849 RepID=A0ABR0JFD4_9EURO|nr:hypothetical protein LTR10_021336 [Elasticomyces elasticus]KAK5027538.1 hypothetical protein LTR13_009470 [Exophiala sideris]KAK5032898.1 hypothetical protein LTS07_004309 [Exophiala sideris]KAK5062422.1 hypothetical protein LTR69_004781 [Exophiala sideris]KAK5177580.1 hypothetical protein LTR44_009991 [Eurotiomycetes sp. CCFEE 6388]
MLRYLFRPARTIRVPLKNGEFDLQRVTVKRKSKVDVPRLVTTFLLSYCVVRTVSHVLSAEEKQRNNRFDAEELKKQLERQNAVVKGSTDSQQQQDEGIPFMLPLWFRRKRAPLYTADDPDWQAFQKVQQDQKVMSDIIRAVMDMVEKEIGTSRYKQSVRAACPDGRILAKTKLSLVPSLYPPDIYEVPCVLLKPNGLSVGWRQLPENVGSKMDHIFHPLAFANAFYAGFKVFCKVSYQITYARLTDRFNSSKTSPSDDASMKEKSVLPQTEQKKAVTETEKTLSGLVSNRLSEDDKAKWLPFLHGEYGERSGMRNYRDLVKSMTYRGAIDEACGMFRAKWVTAQKALQTHANIRNECSIQGSVDLVGTRGVLHLDVFVAYSPANNAIISPLIVHRAYLIPNSRTWHDEKYGRSVARTSSDEKTAGQSPWKDSKVAPEAPESGADTGEEKEK